MTFGSAPFNRSPFNYSIPASETPEGKRRIAAYYASLGEFIDTFSRAEVTVEYVLRHYAKMGPRVAVVILSGVRADAAIKHIKKLVPMRKAPLAEARN
jgi:hypothetical protein